MPPTKLMSRARLLAVLAIATLAPEHGSRRSTQGPPHRREPVALSPGASLEQELSSGGKHHYKIGLDTGFFLEVLIEQEGIDLAARLLDPVGRELLEMDSPNGDRGPEGLLWLATEAGTYEIELAASPQAGAGRYRLLLLLLRPAREEDRRRAAAAGLLHHAAQLRKRGDRGSLRAAGDLYKRAAGLFSRQGDRRGDALALHLSGQIHGQLGELAAQLAAFERSVELYQALRDARGEALLLTQIGKLRAEKGEHELALAALGEALARFQQLGDEVRQARLESHLGRTYHAMGETHRALELYHQALERWRALGEVEERATVLNNLAEVYLSLSELPLASEYLGRALELRRAAGDDLGEAIALTSQGRVEWQRGLFEQARLSAERALAIEQRLHQPAREAVTLVDLGLALFKLGDHSGAATAYQRSQEIARQLGDRRTAAVAELNLGWVAEEQQRLPAALDHYRSALTQLRELAVPSNEASALFGMARVERKLGDLAAARAQIEAALERVETLRTSARQEDLRIAYFAPKRDYYELYIDLLMELHRREPAAGHDALAFQISERSRARSLVEGLGEAPAGSLPSPELQALLGEDTMLLEYFLGEERSFLWQVSRETVESHVLPGRASLEALARQAHQLLTEGWQRATAQQTELVLAALADQMLGPVATHLKKKLLVVSDGALQYIPLAALPLPPAGGGGRRSPLLVDHEIVGLPSAAVLAALRRQFAGRPPAPKTLAVLADPVFSADDSRLDERPAAVAISPASFLSHGGSFERVERLPYSGEEAAALLGMVPSDQRLDGIGFSANLDLLTSGRLAPYRILHLATHGWLDTEHPERSGLLLSLFDERGQPRPGLLTAQQIRSLRLPAELVVLSACRTALGREARGEGLLNLTRGFMVAGARQVVVSLWSVDDRATTELMKAFYREMLDHHLPPATALRRAQLALLEQERFHAPFYWAAFVLQGDG